MSMFVAIAGKVNHTLSEAFVVVNITLSILAKLAKLQAKFELKNGHVVSRFDS